VMIRGLTDELSTRLSAESTAMFSTRLLPLFQTLAWLVSLSLVNEPIHYPHLARLARYLPTLETAARLHDLWSQPLPLVYGLVSLRNRHFYIGCTGRSGRPRPPAERLAEHVRKIMNDNETERVYKHIRNVGLAYYIMLPLFALPAGTCPLSTEAYFVRKEQPSLNSQHVRFTPRLSGHKRHRPRQQVRQQLRLTTPTAATAALTHVPTPRLPTPTEPAIYTNVHTGRHFTCLDSLLNVGSPGPRPSFVFVHYRRANRHSTFLDTTPWRSMQLWAQSPVVTEVGGRVSFAMFAPTLRRSSEGTFSVLPVRTPSVISTYATQLANHVRGPAQSVPPLDVPQVCLALVECRDLADDVRRRVMNGVRHAYRQHGLPPLHALTLRFPDFAVLRSSALADCLQALGRSLHLHPHVLRYLRVAGTVTRPRPRTVATILHNHVATAKAFRHQTRPICTCALFTSPWTVHPQHVVVLPTDAVLCAQHQAVVAQHSGMRPEVSHAYVRGLLTASLLPLARAYAAFATRTQRADNDEPMDAPMDVDVDEDVLAFVDAAGGDATVVARAIDETCAGAIRAGGQPHTTEHEERRVPQREPRLTMEQVMDTRRALQGTVCMPIDKNLKMTALCCPVRYWQLMHATFLTADFDRTHQTIPDLLAHWQRTHTDRGWQAVAPWTPATPPTAAIPYAYVVVKMKNLAKTRPLVSYLHHPMRRLLRLQGRALLCTLEHLHRTEHVRSMTLFSMRDLPGTLASMTETLLTAADTHTLSPSAQLVVSNWDVARMYDMLQHATILDAVRWLTNTASSAVRRHGVSLHRRSKQCYVGPNTDAAAFAWMPWPMLCAITLWCTSSYYLTAGDVLLRQRRGIGQGSPNSPALAIIVCAYFEHRVLSVTASPLLGMTGARWIDDVICVSIVDPLATPAHTYSTGSHDRRMQCLRQLYPTLTLEEQAVPPGCDADAVWLGSHVSARADAPRRWREGSGDDVLAIRPYDKNFPSLLHSGSQRILRLIPNASAHSSVQKRAVLSGVFLRCLRESSSLSQGLAAGIHAIVEAYVLGYSAADLARVLSCLRTTRTDPLWAALLRALRLLPPARRVC
jgi:hypothetical protein